MIITEEITVNGRNLVRTYSDSGMMVKRDEVLYESAVDPKELNRRYAESTIPVFKDVVE